MNKGCPLFILLTFLAHFALYCCAHKSVSREKEGGYSWEKKGREMRGSTYQLFGGATILDKEIVEKGARTDPSVRARTRIDNLPAFGMSAQGPLFGEKTSVGIEGGMVFGWWLDDVDGSSIDGTLRLHVDNLMFLLDLYGGLYGSVDLMDRLRLYAGAGPSLLLGYAELETREYSTVSSTIERRDRSDIDIGLGLYARAGLEFRMAENVFFGIGVRWMRNELDFEDTFGEVDFKGIQPMLSITIQF